MTGGTPKHAKIIGYTFTALDQQLLERDCSFTLGDLRILVNGARSDYAYPDLTVVYGEEVYDGLHAVVDIISIDCTLHLADVIANSHSTE